MWWGRDDGGAGWSWARGKWIGLRTGEEVACNLASYLSVLDTSLVLYKYAISPAA